MLQNGLDREDAIFVIVPLKHKQNSRALYFPAVHKKFQYEDTISPQTLLTYCIFITEQTTEYMSEGTPQQVVEPFVLKSEMPKNIHACPSINKLTERHPREPYYSPPRFQPLQTAACIIIT